MPHHRASGNTVENPRVYEVRNAENASLVSTEAARVVVRVIRTDEELMIARSVIRVLGLGVQNERGTKKMMTNAKSHLANYPKQPASNEEMLDSLQRDAFGYFRHENNPANGLVVDKTQADAPASIAAVGFALAAYPVGVERSWMTRAEATERTLAALRFFWTSPQGTAPDATGYKGFYYHFLDMTTGRRAGRCELSTVDTAFLLAGMLTAATYFDEDCEDEREIRTLADALCRRAD